MRLLLRRIYDWTMRLAEHRYSSWWLGIVSFLESSIFPIPPDVMLVPMILAQKTRAWALASICTAASVFGGIVGYGIGFLLFESIGVPIVEYYGYASEFSQFRDYYHIYGIWIVIAFALTFLPYKVVTIASGMAALEPFSFVIASIIGRGIRFFALAALLNYFGSQIRSFIEARLGLLTSTFFVLLLAGFLIIKFAP